MNALRYVAIASLFLSAAISADEDRSRPRIKVEALNPWTHLDLVNDPENFQFAIVTDRTGGHRAGVFPDAMRKLKSPGQIEINPDSWLGPDDCSWRFSVEMDDTHLYVAVDVTDERQIYKQSSVWTQDGLELRIDARPEPARSQGRDQGGTALLVAISPDHIRQNMGLYQPDVLEREGVPAVGVPTPTGHAYEVSVEAQQGKDWDRIRINIAVDDFDEITGPLAQLWWQPDWRDPANFAGSGTFRRPQE
jgi:hypothetical protein